MNRDVRASKQQGGVSSDYCLPKLAVAADCDQRLDFLDIHRLGEDCTSRTLAGLKAIVIGAGPAGLIFARNAAKQGAAVTVLEQAGDPRGLSPGYTNRSFNITLDNVGRQVLGDPRAYYGGIWLQGRAIHNFHGSDTVEYARYGRASDAELVSIPRPVLRRNLCSLADEAGVELIFHSRVTSANPDTGVVLYESGDGTDRQLYGDLIVYCDGLHSLSNDLHQPDGLRIWPEPRGYISGLILPEHNPGLSLRHIHFWHEAKEDNFTVGIPNADGSVALLIVSLFSDISEQAHPFATPAEAEKRLKRDFPRLYAAAPQLAGQLPKHRRGTFSFKSICNYQVGRKGIIVGDAGLVFPPWAGYGANQAMYGAASLVHALVSNRGRIKPALMHYEKQQQCLSKLLIDFVDGQGDFLSGPVADDPSGRSDPALGMLIREVRSLQLAPKV